METKLFCLSESRDKKILLSENGKEWWYANDEEIKEIKKWLAEREKPITKSWLQRLKEWFILSVPLEINQTETNFKVEL